MFSFTKLVPAAIAVALFVCKGYATTGEATYYLPAGGYGACGRQLQNSDFVVALSPSEYASGANCFRSMSVQYQGRSVEVTVADLCPSCAVGHIDLSEGAFEQLANTGLGVISPVTYNYN
ncbi:RlpA-like double-psi beta-barrel-protein domain-containing protein-containing protein [Dichomitus squalens]|uniref:RlpA-like double-psi beta-barrel-protein domain-containing protein-containing protein n=1 Tax=Dichomitus squalens TaxID=114155 RepID=A0A4Q9MP32_9APHY|nr:uncharacterized protein DICSQDRAFT_98769 [Dichomitus squalens LYAD-421 SS1]EJF65164.1 hypothetical protein DICSQDRAFT_98769 [Dichomitus squalens LYAD-421 SS1]TBU29500.1 RlpA-like double-psi beta-barrel-protein domain-containing protein-containing protein [Dichomitus squalens]TBU42852.1 RlpA-like double-psi beta-barrel-protein domain-containing protein-containing protein [Dichomitus squalens]TBU64607.1 RlpA-like double-psi beta-barrel-protein domain-containing protein-containing protein [Dich